MDILFVWFLNKRQKKIYDCILHVYILMQDYVSVFIEEFSGEKKEICFSLWHKCVPDRNKNQGFKQACSYISVYFLP